MIDVLDIDDWAREIAEAQAEAVRREVQESLGEGGGAAGALPSVSRRLSRLTAEQRRMVVHALARPEDQVL